MKRKYPASPPRRQFKVLVLVSLKYASWRDVLNGIIEFSATRPNWDLRLEAEPGGFLAPQIEEAEREGYSGIILATPGEVDYARLAVSPIPLVVAWGCNSTLGRRGYCSSCSMDPAFAAELGARHLMAGGRRACYGFVRTFLESGWPLIRQEAFLRTVRAAGLPATAFEPAGDGARVEPRALRDWLMAMPKPAAVMADTDRRAAEVVAACRDGGLDIPGDVAVLGVDNDALYVLDSRPPISSVALPHREQGRRISAELDRLMRAWSRGARCVGRHEGIASGKVVVRESTRPLGLGAVLAARVADYVDAHAAEGLCVADVARYLGCSPRLAEMRFKSVRKKTISEYIADRRMQEVCRMLARPRATVASVAVECGFKSASQLSHYFARHAGKSIREWRAGRGVAWQKRPHPLQGCDQT